MVSVLTFQLFCESMIIRSLRSLVIIKCLFVKPMSDIEVYIAICYGEVGAYFWWLAAPNLDVENEF